MDMLRMLLISRNVFFPKNVFAREFLQLGLSIMHVKPSNLIINMFRCERKPSLSLQAIESLFSVKSEYVLRNAASMTNFS